MPCIGEADYLDLTDKVLYWLQQLDIWEDPTAQALANRSKDIQEDMPGDAHQASEVCKNLQWFREWAAESIMWQVAFDSGPHSLLSEAALVSLKAGRRQRRRNTQK